LIRSQALEWSVDVAGIDRARILRGWTRRDLAERAHVDEGTLCDLFACRRHPTFGTLRAVCQALELALADVIEFASNSPARSAGEQLNSR
jgi:DNA-binding Xre family transcriptional regulator